MRKLNLVAMSYEKDGILNALQRTGAAEVKLHADTENTVVPEVGGEELAACLSSAETALGLLVSETENYDRERGVKSDVVRDGFKVSYTEFMSAKDKKGEADEAIARVNALLDEKTALKGELSKVRRAAQSARLYAELEIPFGRYSSTAHTSANLGAIPLSSREAFEKGAEALPLSAAEILAVDEENALVFLLSHRSESEAANALLSACGFSAHAYPKEKTGKEVYGELCAEEKRLSRKLEGNATQLSEMRGHIRDLKIYCDYLGFALEKERLSEKLRATEKTFLLEAYVPAESEASVAEAISSATQAAYYEFSDPSEEETPPTLLKNNKVVRNFESVTNTYSPPNYRELDPNTVMAFFYSLFMGFIIGDAGYGLLMTLVGGLLYFKKKDSGFGRMCAVFAIGGVFAIVWGLLFNSLFGMSLPMRTVMPDPQNSFCTFAGISVPSVLVVSLCIGVAQLFAGYLCRAVQAWRRGNVLDGIFDGVVWAVFSVGVELALVGLVSELGLTVLAKIGGITAGVSLVVAMLTAGRKEKFFGKLTKGFGAAYGVINYASDILSYARLYGLMLSGAVIAQVVSDYAVGFITGGNVLIAVLGVLLMIVGHAFNIAMNLLGAYIHDARLQYVEFYGRFYEGEGELFEPLGSKHKYVDLLPAGETA